MRGKTTKRIAMLLAVLMMLSLLPNGFAGVTKARADSGAGTNLLTNGTFDSDLSGWDVRWSGQNNEFVCDTAFSHSGAGSAKAVSTADGSYNGNDNNKGIYYYNIPLEIGATYKVSFYVYRNDAAKNCPVLSDIDDGTISLSGTNGTASHDTWEFCQYTFVATKSTGALRCIAVGLAQGSAWFDDVTMVKVPEDTTGNLIKNGTFSTDLSNWEVQWSGTNTEFVADTTTYTGDGAARADAVGQSNNGLYQRNIAVEKGKTYKVSFRVFRANGVTSPAYVDINDGTVTYAGTNGTDSINGSWVNCSFTFVAPANTVDLRCVVGGLTAGSVWFDDIVMLKSNVVSGIADRSLAVNGSFENGGDKPTGWNAGTAWSRVGTEETVAPAEGDAMLKVAATSTQICYGQPITVKPNTYYYYTGKIYRTDATGVAYLNLLDSTTADIPGTQIGTDTTGKWVTVSMSWYSGSNTTVYTRCVVDGALSGKPVYFDDVQLTEQTWGGFPAGAALETPDASYELANPSVTADFVVAGNKLYVTKFTAEESGSTEWVTEPIEIPLVGTINGAAVTWQYTSSQKTSITDGTVIEVVFTSADGKYTATEKLTAMESGGPIEFNQSIHSDTESVSVKYRDAFSSNIRLEMDGNGTLYRFSRSRVNDGSDPYFSQGTLTTALAADTTVISSIENGYSPVASILPYQVIDVGGSHGVYFGYYWSFGKILVRTDENNNAAVTTYLDDDADSAITRAAGTDVEIPGFFIGAYNGTVDDGSNQMKNWFWDYKITRSLHDNADEPLVEADLSTGNTDDLEQLFNNFPDIEDYIQILKLDYSWTIPSGYSPRQDVQTEDLWLPNAAQYPNGLNMWEAIHDYSSKMKFSLYMSDTYQGADIGTQEGREAELAALEERFRPENNDYGIGYDYWRSDFSVETAHNYDSHEGLLWILDSMIAKYPDFRYEHCSGAGSLKDFTTLERMTFMTTEDTAFPLNHRMSVYANSYMINPLQLKGDLNMTYNESSFGGIKGSAIIGTNPDGSYIDVWTSPEYVKYALRSAMLGTPMVCFNEEGLKANLDLIKSSYSLYSERQRPILRGCDVYHILAAPTGWDYNDWDGIEYYNDNIDKGVVMLFKENKTAPTDKTIRLSGLDAETMYSVEFIDRTEQNCVKSGAELMENGLAVTGMTEEYDSEMIYLQPVTGVKLTTETLPDGTVGTAYSTKLEANGTEPITYAVTKGQLPDGLTLAGGNTDSPLVNADSDPTTEPAGTISGTPTKAGTYTFTVTASNEAGSDVREYTIVVAEPAKAATAPALTTSSLPDATTGTAYSAKLEASGTSPVTFAVTAGTLPDGLTLTGGVISGTPTKAGTYKFTVTAENAAGKDSKLLTIVVKDASAATPKTGDTSPLWLWLTLAAGASAGIVYGTLTVLRKKRSEK